MAARPEADPADRAVHRPEDPEEEAGAEAVSVPRAHQSTNRPVTRRQLLQVIVLKLNPDIRNSGDTFFFSLFQQPHL